MVHIDWLTPFAQVGHELRIELDLSWRESRLVALGHRLRAQETPVLPEQRQDDEAIIARRKAENLLQSVRHGAVRR